jgi:hypothetical protein
MWDVLIGQLRVQLNDLADEVIHEESGDG